MVFTLVTYTSLLKPIMTLRLVNSDIIVTIYWVLSVLCNLLSRCSFYPHFPDEEGVRLGRGLISNSVLIAQVKTLGSSLPVSLFLSPHVVYILLAPINCI